MIRDNDVLLFQGDSITNAFRKPEELNDAYRMGAGYVLLIGARLRAQRPQAGIRIENRGVSGDSLQRLRARWEEDCLAVRPTLLSILIGVNNALGNVDAADARQDAEGFERDYDDLLNLTHRALPRLRLVLCEPFLLPAGNVTQKQVEAMSQRRAAVRRLAERHHAVFVAFQGVLNEATRLAPPVYWCYDGIHPTAAGHWLLAEAWLAAVDAAGSTGTRSRP